MRRGRQDIRTRRVLEVIAGRVGVTSRARWDDLTGRGLGCHSREKRAFRTGDGEQLTSFRADVHLRIVEFGPRSGQGRRRWCGG